MSKPETATAEKKEQKTPRYRKMTSQLGIDGVEFDNIEDFLGVMKNDEEYTLEHFKKRVFFDALSRLVIRKGSEEDDWNRCKAYTAGECLSKFKGNEQRLMVAFKYIGPENSLKQLKGELISEQKITKKQKRALLQNPEMKQLLNRQNEQRLPADAFKMTEVEYEDTYKLFKIAKKTYHDNGMTRMERDAYVVECICPSKGDHFFLFVPAHEVEQCRTAFGAIAWTFKHHDGSPYSIEEWKELAEYGEEQ